MKSAAFDIGYNVSDFCKDSRDWEIREHLSTLRFWPEAAEVGVAAVVVAAAELAGMVGEVDITLNFQFLLLSITISRPQTSPPESKITPRAGTLLPISVLEPLNGLLVCFCLLVHAGLLSEYRLFFFPQKIHRKMNILLQIFLVFGPASLPQVWQNFEPTMTSEIKKDSESHQH